MDEPEPTLTRELIRSGGLIEMIARSSPGLRILSDAERDASRAEVLARNPNPDGAVWLFAYGSLIWNPTVAVAERRLMRVQGWHRAFCLLARAGRGTARAPGLLLGLCAGGVCDGVGLLVAETEREFDLDLLWRREMIAGSYVPVWLPMQDAESRVVHGIGFTMDPASHSFAGGLTEDQVVAQLATACGELGSCAEYLFRTERGLRSMGIDDPVMARLAERVRVETQRDPPAPGTVL